METHVTGATVASFVAIAPLGDVIAHTVSP